MPGSRSYSPAEIATYPSGQGQIFLYVAGALSAGIETVAIAATTDATPARINVADSDDEIIIPAIADPSGNPERFRLIEIDMTRPSC